MSLGSDFTTDSVALESCLTSLTLCVLTEGRLEQESRGASREERKSGERRKDGRKRVPGRSSGTAS